MRIQPRGRVVPEHGGPVEEPAGVELRFLIVAAGFSGHLLAYLEELAPVQPGRGYLVPRLLAEELRRKPVLPQERAEFLLVLRPAEGLPGRLVHQVGDDRGHAQRVRLARACHVIGVDPIDVLPKRIPVQRHRAAELRIARRRLDRPPIDRAAVDAARLGHLPQLAGLPAVLLPVAVHAQHLDDVEIHLGDRRVGVELAVGAEASHAPDPSRQRPVRQLQRLDLVQPALRVLADAQQPLAILGQIDRQAKRDHVAGVVLGNGSDDGRLVRCRRHIKLRLDALALQRRLGLKQEAHRRHAFAQQASSAQSSPTAAPSIHPALRRRRRQVLPDEQVRLLGRRLMDHDVHPPLHLARGTNATRTNTLGGAAPKALAGTSIPRIIAIAVFIAISETLKEMHPLSS